MYRSRRRIWPAFPLTAAASLEALRSSDKWYSRAFSGGEVMVDGNVLIFFTNAPLLRSARRKGEALLFFDATFSVAPPHFEQVMKIAKFFNGFI